MPSIVTPLPVTPTPSAAPLPLVENTKLPETSFVVIDGQMFLIEKVRKDKNQIILDIKKFYETKCDEFKKTVVAKDFDAWYQDWNRQLQHFDNITRRSSRSTTIPENAYNQPVLCKNGQYGILRTFIYQPNVIKAPIATILDQLRGQYTAQVLARDFIKVYTAVQNKRNTTRQVVININQDKIKLPMAMAKIGDRIYCPANMATYHVFADDNRLCTGNATAAVFWGVGETEFVRNVNVINPMSPARRSINGINYLDLLNDAYVVDINIEENTQWSTSQI